VSVLFSLLGTHILLSEFPDVLLAHDVFTQTELDALADHFARGYKHHASSVTHEASIAAENCGVTAMHDPTEGGLATALTELQEASRIGLTVNLSSIERTCLDATRRLCHFLDVNPMNLIGSGSLLITCAPTSVDALIREFEKNNVQATIIGVMTKRDYPCKVIDANGDLLPLVKPETDELWRALEKMNELKQKMLNDC
jgi:hydrogenase maturation factor